MRIRRYLRIKDTLTGPTSPIFPYQTDLLNHSNSSSTRQATWRKPVTFIRLVDLSKTWMGWIRSILWGKLRRASILTNLQSLVKLKLAISFTFSLLMRDGKTIILPILYPSSKVGSTNPITGTVTLLQYRPICHMPTVIIFLSIKPILILLSI